MKKRNLLNTTGFLLLSVFLFSSFISQDVNLAKQAVAEGEIVFEKLHDFEVITPGINPQYANLVEKDGKFYGMTSDGGINYAGVIFEWDPATNIYTKKIDFNSSNGKAPYSSLVEKDGKFYGMTYQGGVNNAGVIFEWDPVANIYTKKIDLSDSIGRNPYSSLVEKDGKFYGTTTSGGANSSGVIFEWDPLTNIYTKKIDLSSSIGRIPSYSLVEKGGKFYGMTASGGANNGGVIFEWDPATNIYTKKIDFSVLTGYSPHGSLVEKDGKFYGMNNQGGANSVGVIFEWDPLTNIYTKKIDLSSLGGSTPYGSLVEKGGKFYSMTCYGGANNVGVIFEWDPATNIYTKKTDFSSSMGSNPKGSLLERDGKFYGMTIQGGANSAGVIFEWDLATNIYTKKIDLNSSNGKSPYGSLVEKGGKLYGMTQAGGANNAGVIFEWDPLTDIYTKKIDLSSSIGENPYGSLVENGGKFYGMTSGGGANSVGVIFEWDPLTNIYTKKIDLSSSIGSGINRGSLAKKDDKFYGMTSSGGANSVGVIFEWDPVSNIYTKKIDLSNSIGSYAYGTLVEKGGKFYGMTHDGGVNNVGVIFEWDPLTNIYIKKIDLSSSIGHYPYGSLVEKDGKFYGMTSSGGVNNSGVIFEWDPATNIYTKKIDLSSANGSVPYGSLMEKDGKFYGTTSSGGVNYAGVVFEWDPLTNVYTKKTDLSISIGWSSYGSLVEKDGIFYGMARSGGDFNIGTIFSFYIPIASVTYDGNSSTSGTLPTDPSSPYPSDGIVNVLGNTGNLTRTGYTFNGWNTAPDGSGISYNAADTFTITESITLYAQWEPNIYEYQIKLNGGQTYTTSRNIAISIVGLEDESELTEVIICENPEFTGCTWESYENPKSFISSDGDGLKTVYVKLKAGLDNITDIQSAQIILDTINNDPVITKLGLIKNIPDKDYLYYYYTANRVRIYGTAESSSLLQFERSNGTKYTTQADGSGNFLMIIDLLDGETKLTYNSTDLAGNVSGIRTIVLNIGDWGNEPIQPPVEEPVEEEEDPEDKEEPKEEDIPIKPRPIEETPQEETPKSTNIIEKVTKVLGSIEIQPKQVETSSEIVTVVSVPLTAVLVGAEIVHAPTMLIQGVIRLLSLFGIAKRGKKIGLIYDSKSKEPISYAVIRLFKEGKLVNTTVSDSMGYYYFELEKGKYTITVQKAGYKFPSNMIGSIDYPFEKIYKGGQIEVKEKDLLNMSIPLDPTERKLNLSNLRKRIAYKIGGLLTTGWVLVLLFGILSSGYLVATKLSLGSVLSLIWYLIIAVIYYFNRTDQRWKYGKVSREGVALSDISILAKDKQFNTVKGYRKTDENGLYNFVLPKDEYYLEVKGRDDRPLGGDGLLVKAKRNPDVIAKNIEV